MRRLFHIAVLVIGLCLGTAYAASAAPKVELQTSMGNIVLELNAAKAPKTVENFLRYVNEGFYNDTIFHRVINGFMIQGGGFTEAMEQKESRGPVENEANNGLSNQKYTIAMARTSDPHSATAQFFINVKDNPGLDFRSASNQGWGYAVFGKVISGQDVVDRIKLVSTTSRMGHNDVPAIPVVIVRATVLP